mgnify:CR=1 FL=1
MNNIIDPINGYTYSIFSQNGKNLLKRYINIYQTGGSERSEGQKALEYFKNKLKLDPTTYNNLSKMYNDMKDKYDPNVLDVDVIFYNMAENHRRLSDTTLNRVDSKAHDKDKANDYIMGAREKYRRNMDEITPGEMDP